MITIPAMHPCPELYTGHDMLVDLTSEEFNHNCLAKHRLDKQLEDQK